MAGLEGIVLGRIGHLSTGGKCRTAIVQGVNSEDRSVWCPPARGRASLFQEDTRHLAANEADTVAFGSSFHLTRECPYGR